MARDAGADLKPSPCVADRSLMSRPLVATLAQGVAVVALVGLSLRWMQRALRRRRTLAREVDGTQVLAYPPAMTWLGLGTLLAFAAMAAAAWGADTGGPLVGTLFALLALLGLVLVVAVNADTFVVDATGVERRRFGRVTRLPWADITRVTWARGGGIHLEGRHGGRLPVPEMIDGFGVLCDNLLHRAPATVRCESTAAACIVFGSTLDAEPLQRAYAPWFEHEDAEPPPPGLDRRELAVAAGRAFAYRMLQRHGSFVPFAATWTAEDTIRITHDRPLDARGERATFSFDDGAVVIDDGTRQWREPIHGWQ